MPLPHSHESSEFGDDEVLDDAGEGAEGDLQRVVPFLALKSEKGEGEDRMTVRRNWAAALERARETAERVKTAEARVQEAERRGKELVQRAFDKLKSAEARIQALELELVAANTRAQEATEHAKQAQAAQSRLETRAAEAEQRARKAGERAREAEEWLVRFHDAIVADAPPKPRREAGRGG